MARFLSCTFLLFAFSNLLAQLPDSGQFIIHRHLKVIGKETYQVDRRPDRTIAYSINCFYADRGTDVPLKSTILFSATGEPLKMTSSGWTSRHSRINDSVMITTDSVTVTRDGVARSIAKPSKIFPVGGAAPATLQWLLTNWWTANGKAAVVEALFGSIEIKTLGIDTVRIGSGKRVLTAIGIKNLIWGWEFLWIDQRGQLAALATINAEGDKFEFVHPEYEELLLFFAEQSATYGTRQYVIKSEEKRPSAIINGVLVDIEKGTELKDAVVIMVDGKITFAGPASKAVFPPGTVFHDAKGKRILPGLWDMHAHLKQVEWGPAYIAAGITMVRDMGNEFVFINTMKDNIDAGMGVGPAILRAGIIDGPGALSNGIMIAETTGTAVVLVSKYKEAGFEQVKLYGQLQPEVVQAICDEAHRQEMTVAGHIPGSLTTVQAVEMGIDMIAHIHYVMRGFTADSNFIVDFDKPGNRKFLNQLLKKKLVVDPTLAVFEILYRPLNEPMEEIEPAFSKLPASIQADLNGMGLPAEKAKEKLAQQNGYRQLVFQLYKAGVPIVAGTDMMIPGYTLYRELELYVAAGLTPLQALQCATITPARVMNLYSQTGSLVKGKQADIILVDGDPLTNISDLRKISLVFKGGNVYDPVELYPMIGFGK